MPGAYLVFLVCRYFVTRSLGQCSIKRERDREKETERQRQREGREMERDGKTITVQPEASVT